MWLGWADAARGYRRWRILPLPHEEGESLRVGAAMRLANDRDQNRPIDTDTSQRIVRVSQPAKIPRSQAQLSAMAAPALSTMPTQKKEPWFIPSHRDS